MLKTIVNAGAFVLTALPALTCGLERLATPRGEAVFLLWTHVFAQLPGLPGMYLRRAFYCQTLDSCSVDSFIGFGALFTHRHATVEPGVYVGPYAVVGRVKLLNASLIGTRANLLSGSMQHVMGTDGYWHSQDLSQLVAVEIGPRAWIGESATVMASVGAGSAVAAGAVVAAPVNDGVVVAGNPARFVRRVEPQVGQTVSRPGVDGEPLVPSLH